jgi:hypothetical protein
MVVLLLIHFYPLSFRARRIDFIRGLFGIVPLRNKDTTVFPDKTFYSSAKHLIKKFLASINICSRLRGAEVRRAIINTPAILGNSNLHFASFSSRV